MRLDFLILADEAVAEDAEGGARKLNIRGGGLTHVRAPSFPFALKSLAIVARFYVDDEDLGTSQTVELRVVQPDGEQLASAHHEFELPAGAATHPEEERSLFLLVELTNLELPDAGRYLFELWLADNLVDSRSLAAVVEKAPQGSDAS